MIVEEADAHGGERGQQFVVCPYCRAEGKTMEHYVHPVGVRIYPVSGTTEVSVDIDGTEIRPTDAAASQHGASVVLRFRCEEGGHEWESELRFDKGITAVTDRRLADYDIETSEPFTLWRD
jgi:hypothetical protein